MNSKERYLIVGLGNPGPKYSKTRHNMGFEAIDILADHLGVKIDRLKHKALLAETNINGVRVMLAKPQTFMNLSGEAVGELARYYNIDMDHIMVLYDDLDLPMGALRIRKKGSAGTHNGMRNIVSHLGNSEFPRVRIGIGSNGQTDIIDYVIGNLSKEERKKLDTALEKAAEAVRVYITDGIEKAMNKYNGQY